MNKQFRLYQLTNQSTAISLKNIILSENAVLIQIIKKHGGKWNVMLSQFEVPLYNLSSLVKDIKNHDQRLIIKDIPLVSFKSLLQMNMNEDDKSKYMQISLKSKWNRILLFDPLLVKRYDFFFKFLSPATAKRQTRKIYKKVLLVCWQRTARSWVQTLDRAKVAFKQADYQSFMQEQNYKIACTPLHQSEVDILTYERLDHCIINKNVLGKYTTVVCDDAEVWFNNQTALYSSHDIAARMRKILTQRYSTEKDLILITAKLPLQRPTQLLEICNILKPKQFGCDVFRIARKECNDATWIKKRYLKQNKFSRQFYYLLQSNLLINLSPPKQSALSIQHKITYNTEPHSLQRIKAVGNRFKNINQKAVLNNFQSQRLKNTYLLSQTSKLQQARYVKQLRDAMILDKLPALTKYLFHTVKELNQRTVLVLESMSTLQKVEKFLVEQQVAYLVYEISCQELKKGSSYLKYNTSQSLRLCILVRDKLLQEYRKCKLQYEKQLEQAMQMQAERELGITAGGLYELAIHHKNKLNHLLFKKDNMLDLPKINSAHHIVYLDTFWYDFSNEKESIIANILDAKQLIYVQGNGNVDPPQQNGDTNCSHIQTYRRIDTVKVYFLADASVERGILYRYNLNLQAHQEEEQQKNTQDPPLGLQQFISSQLERQQKRCEGRRTLTQLYDIDEQYDRLEFQVLKQKEQQKKQPQIPQYNNHIQGLIPQTPCLKQLEFRSLPTHTQQEKIILQQIQTPINQIAWLNQKSQQQQFSEEQSCLDLRKYLANQRINEEQSQKYLQNLQKIMQAKHPKKQEEVSDSYDQSIHLSINQQQSNSTVQKQLKPKQQKHLIAEPNDIIEIDDNEDDIFPLPIVSRHSVFPQNFSPFKQTIIKPQQRHASVPGLKLWGSKSSGNKKIARKYMNIRIQLMPNASSLRGSH